MTGEIHEQDHHEYVNRKVTFFMRAFSWKGTVWCYERADVFFIRKNKIKALAECFSKASSGEPDQ